MPLTFYIKCTKIVEIVETLENNFYISNNLFITMKHNIRAVNNIY